ncbi:phage integrase Arm DNA-binding domain-containing protein [Vreelandella malpeensis]|uniref:Phage integrase Arm DNA-binding domain-containing protein n=1 Tax=Vreelandella malpeensis TaxID=1172368 RepID=A0ABS8DVU7_9GAMM|nr:phage integrase Arm DNA-binding domain-containing protein [Halomonas malpeensis]MCB8889970.1 phage integrase Arm DNA-binding domain-containing protein [Halomonas malpeensis]
MAPRPRKRKNKGLEPNLYENRGYYTYRRPDTGTRHGMGRDRAKAQDAARVLNARLGVGGDLVAEVMGESGVTLKDAVHAWLAEWVEPSKLGEWTKKAKRGRGNRIIADAGNVLLEHVTTRWCAEYLDENHHNTAYVQYRAVLSQIFQFAQTKGWATVDPVTPTRKDNFYEKQRQRLTVEQFRAIHAAAPPWFQIAMELSLVCLLGRAEVVAAKYDDAHDGRLHYIRQKTKERSKTAYVAIGMTDTMEDIIKRSRQIEPVSPHIVHRRPSRMPKRRPGRHWSQVTPDYLSRTFNELAQGVPTIRSMPEEQRPTYHEIRALGSRLLELKGVSEEEIQVLMGHSDVSTTQVYLDKHDTRWQLAQGNPFNMETLLKAMKQKA